MQTPGLQRLNHRLRVHLGPDRPVDGQERHFGTLPAQVLGEPGATAVATDYHDTLPAHVTKGRLPRQVFAGETGLRYGGDGQPDPVQGALSALAHGRDPGIRARPDAVPGHAGQAVVHGVGADEDEPIGLSRAATAAAGSADSGCGTISRVGSAQTRAPAASRVRHRPAAWWAGRVTSTP